MTGLIGFNESLQFVQAPYIQNLVTIESCKEFVQQQLLWNKIYPAILVLCLVFIFYLLYKQGHFKKEIEAVKENEDD